MFGTKQEKANRLQEIIELLRVHHELTVAQIASYLGVPRSTIWRDLPVLEEYGVRLQECDGKLSFYEDL